MTCRWEERIPIAQLGFDPFRKTANPFWSDQRFTASSPDLKTSAASHFGGRTFPPTHPKSLDSFWPQNFQTVKLLGFWLKQQAELYSFTYLGTSCEVFLGWENTRILQSFWKVPPYHRCFLYSMYISSSWFFTNPSEKIWSSKWETIFPK